MLFRSIENDNAATKAAERKQLGKSTPSNDKPARQSFCPPIFLYNINIKHLVDQLEARIPKIVFKIKNVNRSKSKLYLADVNIHEEMMTILKEKKVNSYSFTPKELRKTSLIIRGLYAGIDASGMKDERLCKVWFQMLWLKCRNSQLLFLLKISLILGFF